MIVVNQLWKRAVLGVAACMLGAIAGCEEKKGETATGGGAKATESKPGDSKPDAKPGAMVIKIGHYGSLTGSKASFGKSTDNGIRLAAKQINDAGGATIGGKKYTIEVVSEDTEGKAEKAGTVVTKLITKDKVNAVLGEVASSISLQGAPVCQAYGVPMITPSSTNPEVTAKGDMIFRVCFIDPFQGFACAKFAATELKAKKVAVLFDQASAYSVGLKDEFNKAFKDSGGQVVSEQTYSEGAADFNAQLTRIRESSPDVIFIPGYYTEVANIAIQARKLGMKMPLLGGDGWDSDELGKNAKESIEGCFYSNHYAPDQPTPVIQNFVKQYQQAYSQTPDGLAALGYDAAKILVASMERSGATSGKGLRDAIAATKDHPGVTGSITINAKRDAVKPVVMVERKGGQWVFRAAIEPSK